VDHVIVKMPGFNTLYVCSMTLE